MFWNVEEGTNTMGWVDLRNEARHNNSQPESPILSKISSPVPWENRISSGG